MQVGVSASARADRRDAHLRQGRAGENRSCTNDGRAARDEFSSCRIHLFFSCLLFSAATEALEELERLGDRHEGVEADFALGDPPLHTVGIRGGGHLGPIDALGVHRGMSEDAVEGVHALAAAVVLLRVHGNGAVGILAPLLAGIASGAGGPADVLLHTDLLARVREEVVEVGRAVLHRDVELRRVVVESDLAAVLRGRLGGDVVVFDMALHELVHVLALAREVPRAGADEQVVTESEVVLARRLDAVRTEVALVHVRAADGEAVRGKRPLQLRRALAEARVELDRLVADLRDLGKGLVESVLMDVRTDGVELHGDCLVAFPLSKSRYGAGRSQRGNKFSSFHVLAPLLLYLLAIEVLHRLGGKH